MSAVAGKVLNLERMSCQSDHADEDRRSVIFLFKSETSDQKSKRLEPFITSTEVIFISAEIEEARVLVVFCVVHIYMRMPILVMNRYRHSITNNSVDRRKNLHTGAHGTAELMRVMKVGAVKYSVLSWKVSITFSFKR